MTQVTHVTTKMQLKPALDDEKIVDGARVLFLSADCELTDGDECEITIAAPRLTERARFVAVTPFAGDAAAPQLVATTVTSAARGAVTFRARRLAGGPAPTAVRFDVLLRV